ncbi:MAG TPA: peptide chain release factor N(5)-glutamine methyltransferase [Candidatus Binataceae bacterium]|nr:peptide chain release factor N(5)-glutamine methyltransferase [Candidatus Binataceae bacterium]
MLDEAADKLARAGVDTARLDAEVLLAHACGVLRAQLISGAFRIDADAAEKFRRMVERRAAREPIAYIIGRKEFFSLDFEVTPAVLIPRPETEILVDAALKFLTTREHPLALDIGTGSGAIAIAIAVNAPEVRIIATDISKEALEVARRNAIRHRCEDRIDFVHADLFPDGDARFDLIVSNPPYVAEVDLDILQPEIRLHEPRVALVFGEDGLDMYRRITAGCCSRLNPDGEVMVEIGAGQAFSVEALFRRAGFSNIDAIRDLARIERVIRALL